MKEKFRLVIESLHLPDCGLQENVSLIICFCIFFMVGWWLGVGKKQLLSSSSLLQILVMSESWLYEGEFCYLHRKFAYC